MGDARYTYYAHLLQSFASISRQNSFEAFSASEEELYREEKRGGEEIYIGNEKQRTTGQIE